MSNWQFLKKFRHASLSYMAVFVNSVTPVCQSRSASNDQNNRIFLLSPVSRKLRQCNVSRSTFAKVKENILKLNISEFFVVMGLFLINIVNEVKMTSLSQFYYIRLIVLPSHFSLSISVSPKLNRNST